MTYSLEDGIRMAAIFLIMHSIGMSLMLTKLVAATLPARSLSVFTLFLKITPHTFWLFSLEKRLRQDGADRAHSGAAFSGDRDITCILLR